MHIAKLRLVSIQAMYITSLFVLGLGCSTVLSPEAATLSVAQIIGLTNHTVWAKLRAQQLNQRISLEEADRKFQAL